MNGYSARDVASILGVPAARVRSIATAVLTPQRGARGEYRFSFQDLVLLRTARALLDSGVPTRRLRRAIEQLKEQLPDGTNITEVRIAAFGDRIVVRDGEAVWNPEDGQALFDFSTRELEAGISNILRPKAVTADHDSSDEWFDRGWDLEESSIDEAERAYRRAIDLDPSHGEAHLNLGRLLHERGAYDEAEAHYRRSVDADASRALAWFNLGVLYEDIDRLEDAAAAYRKALEIEPDSVDAHYNLGGVYERMGREREAIRHLSRFRKLTGGDA